MAMGMGTSMLMVVVVVVIVAVTVVWVSMHHAPGAPKHPQGGGGNQCRRNELQIGFAGLRAPVLAEIKPAHGNGPDHGSVRERSRQAEHHRLHQRTAHRNDESGHNGFGVARLQPMERPQCNSARQKKPGIGSALLEQLCEIVHRQTIESMLTAGKPVGNISTQHC